MQFELCHVNRRRHHVCLIWRNACVNLDDFFRDVVSKHIKGEGCFSPVHLYTLQVMSHQCPERMWGPPGLLFSGCRENRSVEGREGDHGVQLPTNPNIENSLSMCGVVSPLCLPSWRVQGRHCQLLPSQNWWISTGRKKKKKNTKKKIKKGVGKVTCLFKKGIAWTFITYREDKICVQKSKYRLALSRRTSLWLTRGSGSYCIHNGYCLLFCLWENTGTKWAA